MRSFILVLTSVVATLASVFAWNRYCSWPKPARGEPPMTVGQLTGARPVILDNARTLLEESRLLLNEHAFARGYALTVLAREELGKLAVVISTVYRLRAADPVDWNRFYRRTFNHTAKLKIAAMLWYLNALPMSAKKDPKRTLLKAYRNDEFQKVLDEGKQDGFYVGLGPNGSTDPKVVITSTAAEALYAGTKTLLMFFDAGEEDDSAATSFAGISDLYGKFIQLADDLVEVPKTVTLPR